MEFSLKYSNRNSVISNLLKRDFKNFYNLEQHFVYYLPKLQENSSCRYLENCNDVKTLSRVETYKLQWTPDFS